MTVARLLKLYDSKTITRSFLLAGLIDLLDGDYDYTVEKVLDESSYFKEDFLNEINRIFDLRDKKTYWPVSDKIQKKIVEYCNISSNY